METTSTRELAAMIDTHRVVILGICVSALRAHPDCRVDPEDLVQDCLVAVAEAWPRIGKARNRLAYMRACVRNAARRSIRRAMRGVPTVPYPPHLVGS